MTDVALDKLIPGRRRGLMLVMSSPSGAGKTSISRAVLAAEPEIVLSVSVTTRPQRPGEADGKDYHFIDEQRFKDMRDAGELLEHARVYGHFYGTPKKPVMDALDQGSDVLFDIDWQGAQQMREVAGVDMVGIFILPPSKDELARRLRTRAQDSEDVVNYRLSQVINDVTHWPEYDYVLINVELENSIAAVRSILTAERLRRKRQPALHDHVRQFREKASIG